VKKNVLEKKVGEILKRGEGPINHK